jgi:SAM-dependent methyltransferase
MTNHDSSSDRTSYHDVHLIEATARATLWQVLVEYLSGYVPPQAHVLELGAGFCYWINGVAAARKVAIDVWPDLPKYAAPDVQSLQHDLALGLPRLAGGPFDVVLASNVLEHFEPDVTARLIAEVFACLRRPGRFIVIQPNFRFAFRSYFDDYTHRSIFTEVSLSNLMRAQGFHIERLQRKFLPYSLRDSRWPIRPWLIRAYLRSPFKPLAGQMLIVGRKDK